MEVMWWVESLARATFDTSTRGWAGAEGEGGRFLGDVASLGLE